MRDRTPSAHLRLSQAAILSPHFPLRDVGSSRPPGRLVRATLTACAFLSLSSYALADPRPGPLDQDAVASAKSAQPRLTPEEVETVLPLFLRFPETRQFAAALEGSIKHGDFDAAKDLIDKAVEASTFAVLASDWLQDPAFVRMLNARGIHGAAPSVPESADEIGELRKSLQAERERSEALEREHAAMAERLAASQASQDTIAAAAAQANDWRDALERERERSEGLAAESAIAAQKLATLEGSLAQETAEAGKLREALDRERERSQSLGRDYAAASESLAALQGVQDRHAASLSEVSELKRALDVERERSQSLARDLAAASETLTALQGVRDRDAAASAEVSELKRALEVEQQRSLSLARDYATLTMKLSGVQVTHSIGNQAAKGAPATGATRAATQAADSTNAPADLTIVPALPANPLVTRAEALFRSGDVSGARLLLERASEAGDPAAIFLLAETFDPAVLSRLAVIGVRGDRAKADELYARARRLRNGPESVQAGAVQ